MAENLPQTRKDPAPPPRNDSAPPQGSSGRRLDSWKAIAVYLKRDVRTVKRWEKSECLPVHRHQHGRQASVYAFAEELEAWRANRRPVPPAPASKSFRDPEKTSAPKKKRWTTTLLAGAVVIIALVGIGYWLTRASALPFVKRDWVLIARFDNRTGDAVFDGAVEYALGRELANSRFVNVVPRERVADALQLMRKPPDTPVDARIGREVCLRDGGIRALITGRIERFDTTYVLSAELVNPQTGATVASFRQEAEGKKGVVPAVGRLADRVRRTLGEELAGIRSDREALAKVTTPSLEALHLFTQADAVIARSDEGNASAEQLLRRAIAVDPEFASAYIYLAFAVKNQHRPPEEYRPYAQRALDLSDKSSDSERYFILGAYHFMMGDVEKAVASYRTLVQLYPDHYWGNNNLGYLLPMLGRFRESVPYRVKMAQLQPHDFMTNFSAGWSLVNWAQDRAAARPYVDRARQLITEETRERFAPLAAWTELLPFPDDWRQDRIEDALAELDRFAKRLDSLHAPARAEYAWQLAGGYLTLGKLRAARALFRSLADDERTQGLAMLAWVRGDRQGVGEQLRNPARSDFNAMLLASAGFPEQAEQAMRVPSGPPPGQFWLAPQPVRKAAREAAMGHLALARSQTAEAIGLLKQALAEMQRGAISAHFFVTADTLARALEENGDRDGALRVLEQSAQDRNRINDSFPGAFWLHDEWHRVQLLRRMGRTEEADTLTAALHRLLVSADPGYPLLHELGGPPRMAAAQAGK